MKDSISQSRGTFINLITGILTMAVQLIVNFFLSPYIVRTLGEEANGFTQLANNFVSYATLITLAFNSMAGRFMSVHYHRGEHKKVKKYYSSVTICNIIISLILLPICIYIIVRLDNIISIGNSDVSDVKVLFTCVFANYFLSLILSIFSMSMFVTNRLYVQNVINLGRNVLNALILLCVFAVFPPHMYYVSLVSLILAMGSVPIYAILQRRILPEIHFERSYFRFLAVVELLKAGIWNTVNQCGNMLMTGLDLLLTNWFIDAATMGILSVAKTIPNAIVSLANVLNTSFAPELTINWAKGDKQGIVKQLRRSMKISSVILSIPIVTFCTFAVHFYSLWQPTLDPRMLSALSFLTMMALIPFSGTQTLYNVFTATNQLKKNSLTFILGGSLNILIVFIILKCTTIGVYAVAGVSSCITIIRNLVFVVPYTAKLLGLKWTTFYKDVCISLITALISYTVSKMAVRIVNPHTWILLAVSAASVCTVTFVIDLFVILNMEERKILIHKLKR